MTTPTTIPIISIPSSIVSVSDDIWRGDSSNVKLMLNSIENVNAVKTSLNLKCAKLIEREISILKTLKHPLIVRFRDDILNVNSRIVTEFIGNGSLASHLPTTMSHHHRRLNGVNRITRIIVGIALAMRYLHSHDIIHRDLKPDNI
jgi:serine/threonine protein kinase